MDALKLRLGAALFVTSALVAPPVAGQEGQFISERRPPLQQSAHRHQPTGVSESRPWIGVFFYDVSRPGTSQLKVNIFVAIVDENSPASLAGMRPGDVIVEFGGRRLLNSQEFICLLAAGTPGDVVQLTANREGEELAISLATGDWPSGVRAPRHDCARNLGS